ncbi:MAG: serine/threonine-protein kinase [Pirellulales bacterium]
MRAIADENVIDKLLDHHRNLWESGQRPIVRSLVQEIPESLRDDATLDLIYNEIVLRESDGETPTLNEYLQAYPQYEAELIAQFEVHKAISDGILIDTQKNRALETDGLQTQGEKSSDVTESIDGYELLREVGRGGFAIVYQAKNKQLRRDVAIKMFQPGRIPSSKELGRFRSEATAVARLNHPNIVQIFEIGQWAGVPFLALEFVDGGTLARKLERSLLPAREAATLIEKLARAIQHAHERGVIHRDLKPANVLFDSKGQPKIADFGLAKLLESENNSWEATRTGEPLGTPRYMAPEQASGNSSKIGKCTDVYALGVLLYECLTGQAPFVAASVVESLKKITQDEPISPRKLQPSIPRDLATICLKCLEKQPIRRYGSAAELADDLGPLLGRQSNSGTTNAAVGGRLEES